MSEINKKNKDDSMNIIDDEDQNVTENSKESLKEEKNETDIKEQKKLQLEVEKLTKENDQLKKDVLLGIAELDNLRKRNYKDIEITKNKCLVSTIKAFLPFIDDVKRLMSNMPQDLQEQHKSFKEGAEMVNKKFISILDKYNIVEINPKIGDKFDYNIHNAFLQEESNEYKSGHILKVLEVGYMMESSKTLLRASMVVVSM